MVSPKYHVFVCASCRLNGQIKGFCASKDAAAIIGRFMEELDDRELSGEVMVTNTGCFGVCDKGPIVVVYPEGIWYKGVTEDDVERIVEQHLENGAVVADLQL